MRAFDLLPRYRLLLFLLLPLLAAMTACGGGEEEEEATPTAGQATETTAELQDHFLEAAGLRWHYVSAGEGIPVVFLHGLPESWYSWHYQIEALKDEYQVIAIDLKGYGQSDKADGDYSAANVAEEVLALIDAMGLERFALVTHDWGTLIGDFIAGRNPDRIIKYVRMEAPVHKTDPALHPQFVIFQDQERAVQIFSAAEEFVHAVYGSRCVQEVPEQDIQRIIEEWSRPGVAEAVARYFRDVDAESLVSRQALYTDMDFPVLLLQADSDPAQPQWYFEGATDQFPDAELRWVTESGHFSELEQPDQVTQAIREFLGQ